MIHFPRLKDRFATHFVPFAQFEADAAAGDLADFSFIEPCIAIGHNDYHPAMGRSLGHGVDLPGVDPPSSILGGEALLARIYDAYRGMQSDTGSNVWNTTLLIGWDEPGGTYDHVPPRRCRHPTRLPRRARWASRSTGPATGSRPSSCRRGSPRATCSTRSTATRRSSRPCASSGTWVTRSPRETPRPAASPTCSRSTRHATRHLAAARPRGPFPSSSATTLALGKTLSVIGGGFLTAMRHYAAQHELDIEGLPKDPNTDLPPEHVVEAMRGFLATFFPLLSPTTTDPVAQGTP